MFFVIQFFFNRGSLGLFLWKQVQHLPPETAREPSTTPQAQRQLMPWRQRRHQAVTAWHKLRWWGHSQHNSHSFSPINREARAIRSETLYSRSKKQQLANVESAWKGRCFSCKKHLFPTRLSWCCFPNIWVGQLKTQDVSFPCWFMWSEANMSYDL